MYSPNKDKMYDAYDSLQEDFNIKYYGKLKNILY